MNNQRSVVPGDSPGGREGNQIVTQSDPAVKSTGGNQEGGGGVGNEVRL